MQNWRLQAGVEMLKNRRTVRKFQRFLSFVLAQTFLINIWRCVRKMFAHVKVQRLVMFAPILKKQHVNVQLGMVNNGKHGDNLQAVVTQKTCPGNQVHKECGPACVATCTNPNSQIQCEQCVNTCDCPAEDRASVEFFTAEVCQVWVV
eukprot:g34931.t1